MTQSKPRLVTGLMLGSFLALGVDTLVVVGALWYVGRLSDAVAGAVSIAVVVVFAAWVIGRWVRLRWGSLSDGSDAEHTQDSKERTPLDRLKEQYVAGDLSNAEFEERLGRLLDADRRVESREGTVVEQHERSRESE